MTTRPYKLEKAKGSSQAYIVDTRTGKHVYAFNATTTRDWQHGDKKLARLNAEARDGVKR